MFGQGAAGKQAASTFGSQPAFGTGDSNVFASTSTPFGSSQTAASMFGSSQPSASSMFGGSGNPTPAKGPMFGTGAAAANMSTGQSMFAAKNTALPAGRPISNTSFTTGGAAAVNQKQGVIKDGIRAQFVGGGAIGIWYRKSNTSERDRISIARKSGWQTDASRSLLNQGRVIFHDLQKIRDTAADPTNIDAVECRKISGRYRAALMSCARDAGIMADEQSENECNGFYEMDELWHLCDIFFVRKPLLMKTGGLVLQDLLEWVRQHNHTTQDTLAMVQSTVGPVESHPMYWEVIFSFLFQGQTSVVRKLLELHSGYVKESGNAFDVTRRLLYNMPVLSPDSSSTQFFRVWCQWQNECREWLEQPNFESEPELEGICRLLSGDISFLEEENSKQYAGTWTALMVARLLYINPLAKFFDLDEDMHWAIDTMGAGDSLDDVSFDALLYLTMSQSNPLPMLAKSCKYFSFNWWFASHMADLLIACGGGGSVLSYRTSDRLDLRLAAERDRIMIQFAETLLADPGLFIALAPGYLSRCGDLGLACLEAHLEHVPLDSNKRAAKVLGICKKYNLMELHHELCRVLGRQSLSNGQTSTSMQWFHRANDGISVSKLADRLLLNLKNGSYGQGSESFRQTLEIFRPAIKISDRLAFLATYSDFLNDMKQDRLVAAGEKLVFILGTPNMAPRWFWINLLMDALPLLENQTSTILNKSQTLILMQCLQEVSISHYSKSYLACAGPEYISGIETLRLALARNLARAMLE